MVLFFLCNRLRKEKVAVLSQWCFKTVVALTNFLFIERIPTEASKTKSSRIKPLICALTEFVSIQYI